MSGTTAPGDAIARGPRSEGAGALLPAAAAPSTQDAIGLLRADHLRVDALLNDCQRLAQSQHGSAADRSAVVSRLGALLIAHAQLEQQLFYPMLGLDATQMEQATSEHGQVTEWLQRLSEPDTPASEFAGRVAQLAAQVREHVRKEEAEFFPKAVASGTDLQALGTQMALRRGALLGDQGID